MGQASRGRTVSRALMDQMVLLEPMEFLEYKAKLAQTAATEPPVQTVLMGRTEPMATMVLTVPPDCPAKLVLTVPPGYPVETDWTVRA